MLRPDAGGQTIDYTAITQPWLRGLVKQWNQQRLVSHSVGLLRLERALRIALSACLVCGLTGARIRARWAAKTSWTSWSI